MERGNPNSHHRPPEAAQQASLSREGGAVIGQLVELSAVGRKLKCCVHLIGHVGLIVDVSPEDDCNHTGTKFWIEWVGMDYEKAYPQRWQRPHGYALTNGTWNRRDFKLVKINK